MGAGARQAAAKARAEAEAAQAAAIPAAPVAPVMVPAPRPVQEQELVFEDLTREQVRDWRVRTMKNPQLVFDHIDRYGESSARHLFTGRLVDQVPCLAGLGHLNLGYIPWG
ncbi:hypothetical protein [Streptomyces cyslabdanicus]|uniref:hypothetical protein n=1 Tax=Streptomyces cyslabdanicus TaxID=1470456 RepID=UPI00404498E3